MTHQDRFTNDPHGFPEMIADWEETVKKYAEQAESQNDNLAEDKELCALKQSAEAGIKTRSKEYAAMLRKMTPEQENAYQSTKGTSAKAQFRLDWAKEQYALAKKSRVEKQSWKEADADIGEYKVLAKIVEDEGFAVDALGAFKRAQSITSKCAQLGGKWVHFDVMRNELTFLHVRKQHNHTFEYAWNLFTTEGQSSAKSTSAEKPACSSTVTDKPAGAETPAQSAGRGTKRTTKHDEDDRAKAKAKATPRPSPKKSRGCKSCSNTVPRSCSLFYYAHICCGERPRVDVGQHGAHVGRSEETCENDERLGRYEHAALSHRHAKR